MEAEAVCGKGSCCRGLPARGKVAPCTGYPHAPLCRCAAAWRVRVHAFSTCLGRKQTGGLQTPAIIQACVCAAVCTPGRVARARARCAARFVWCMLSDSTRLPLTR